MKSLLHAGVLSLVIRMDAMIHVTTSQIVRRVSKLRCSSCRVIIALFFKGVIILLHLKAHQLMHIYGLSQLV